MVATKPFFQVAVGLIPTLLLGGLVAERLQRPRAQATKEASTRALVTAGLAGLGFFLLPVLAEVLAIDGAIGGTTNDRDVWIVAAALVFGTCILAVAVIEPWLRPIGFFDEWKNSDPRVRFVKVAAVLSILNLGVVSVILLHSAVDLARSQDALNRELARSRQVSARLRETPNGEWATFVRRIDATEHLVTLQQRVYRVPRPITDEALQTLAGLRLAALLGSGNVPRAAEQLLTEATLLFDKTVARAKRKQRA